MKTTDNRQRTVEELEAKLIAHFGTERPFTVPEGYFESLTDRVISKALSNSSYKGRIEEDRPIEEKVRKEAFHLGRGWRWAVAAVLVSCVAMGGLLFENSQQATGNNLQTAEDIQYIEDALDYSMIDNMSIASYLTEAE